MDLETYVREELKEIKTDVKALNKDVKALLILSAVEKAKSKRNTMLFSGCISLIVSLISGVTMFFITHGS